MVDAQSFEQLVLPHLNSAHNLARWLIRDASLAEDIVQDAVLRALELFLLLHGRRQRTRLVYANCP